MALGEDERNGLEAALRAATGLDSEQKSLLLGLLREKKRYGLVWEDKPEIAYEELRKHLPVLREVTERRIVGLSPDSPDHVLIEGDNLHALMALQYTHASQVDVIYIDPPYNTGNKDFTYNDHFVDKEDQWRHSKWLSFMEKRLKLAKNLLKDTGVIFISIDDNEQAQLKLLCDEVFDHRNLIACLPTVMNLKGNQDQFGFAGTHEYTYVYCANIDKAHIKSFPVSEDDVQDEWDLDDFGPYKKGAPLVATGADAPRSKRPFMFYPILISADNEITTVPQDEFELIYDRGEKKFNDAYVESLRVKYEAMGYAFVLPKTGNTADGFARWRWGYSLENIKKLGKDIIVNRTKNSITLYKKQRPGLGDLPVVKPKSIWYKPEYSSGNGTGELKSVLLSEVAGGLTIHPKPIELIQDLLYLVSESNSLILDFFAGSGTTLHATMALNALDNGKRRCILVTNNENDICEKVTYERNKRVIQGYTNAKGVAVAGLVDNALRYYKMELVERTPLLRHREMLVRRLRDLLCLGEGCYQTLETGSEAFEAFRSAAHDLLLVYDSDAIEEVVHFILDHDRVCKVYVNAPGCYPFTEDFEEVAHRVELVALPEAFYHSLKPVLPKENLVSAEAAQ